MHHFGASMPTMERPATLETSTGSLNRATKSVESRSQSCPAKPVQACHTEFTLWSPDSTGRMPWKPAELLYEWHKAPLRDAVTALVAQWEPKLGVQVERVFLQRMKTRWGGCNHRAGNIRLNTELVKKPRDLLEYVVVHEMLHLIEPTHSERFVELLGQHFPAWREARAELNALPLADEMWSGRAPTRRR